MKKLGMLLIFVLINVDCLAAQPLSYRGEPGFCERVFHYINQRPVDHHGRPRKRYLPPPGALPTMPSQPMIKLTKDIPPVDSVFVRGGVNLEIIGGSPKNKVSVKKIYPGLAVKVCDGAAYISYTKPVECNQNPRPCMKLYIQQLKRLVVAGDSCITGCHLETYCGLSIEHCGSGAVCLSGPIHLVRIVNSGSAVICIPHVTSDHVHILATRNSVTKLRGGTGLLLIRAFQHATVDTRFMCSDTALVQAANESLVTVKTRGILQAFASEMSNIYYYTTPSELLQHNVLSGNVFQMGCW